MDSIKIEILNTNVEIPTRQTNESAGYDLHSYETCILYPNERRLINTNLYLAIPQGYEGQVRSRSGLAYKHGIIVLNSPGTIDSDYRGEIKILLYNTSNIAYTVNKGDRIAQIIFTKYEKVSFTLVNNLYDTNRNDNGFGSTGK